MTSNSQPSKKPRNLLIALVALSAIIFCLSSSYYFVVAARSSTVRLDMGDLSTVLFGATSLALVILSILMPLWATIFGRQAIQEIARKAVEAITVEKIGGLESELRGRVASVLGYLVGEASINPDILEPRDRERLEQAVRHCQEGYDFLIKVGGPAMYMGLNNLVFYECLLKDAKRGEFLLEKGRSLKELSAEKEVGSNNVFMTGCRAILQYGQGEEREKARKALTIIADTSHSERERREATAHLASFPGPP